MRIQTKKGPVIRVTGPFLCLEDLLAIRQTLLLQRLPSRRASRLGWFIG
jgi:hypothetical protein